MLQKIGKELSDKFCPGKGGHNTRKIVWQVFLEDLGPKSVPRVSPECPGHLFDTPGHSRDTFWTHPVGHSLGHPRFSGTLSGTLRARRARESPVAGRGVRKALMQSWIILLVHQAQITLTLCNFQARNAIRPTTSWERLGPLQDRKTQQSSK